MIQSIKACLGIRCLNHTELNHGTLGEGGCKESQVLEEEKTHGGAAKEFLRRNKSSSKGLKVGVDGIKFLSNTTIGCLLILRNH
ncbi:unnamed protein product [Arabis nemorensis]|uniref:Uncharacterized protein n=1 Tax=Arabis nemorensis TaxID=586526 RepID=A0A565BLN2_9BRAS|nr:unnamed protein product [Arabis nemorensis]